MDTMYASGIQFILFATRVYVCAHIHMTDRVTFGSSICSCGIPFEPKRIVMDQLLA